MKMYLNNNKVKCNNYITYCTLKTKNVKVFNICTSLIHITNKLIKIILNMSK